MYSVSSRLVQLYYVCTTAVGVELALDVALRVTRLPSVVPLSLSLSPGGIFFLNFSVFGGSDSCSEGAGLELSLLFRSRVF